MESKESVCLVTEELEWNGLQTSEWKKINNIVDFLQPFAKYTTLCCREDHISLSAVVPIIMELNCHHQEIQKQPGMGTVARVLHSEMHKRFDRYIDPSIDLFDGLHIVSTLLDPQYFLIFSNEQLDDGICYVKELVKYFVDTQVQSHGKTRNEKDITTQKNNKEVVIEPPLKKFRYLSKLVSKQISQNKEIASTTSEEQEVDLFIQQRNSNPPDVMDALDFWVKSESLFPVLSKLVCDVYASLFSTCRKDFFNCWKCMCWKMK